MLQKTNILTVADENIFDSIKKSMIALEKYKGPIGYFLRKTNNRKTLYFLTICI